MAERGVPEALDVEHFAQARIQELEFLDAAVAAVSNEGGDGGLGGDGGPSSTPAGGLRDQAQGVPRHMRRRTTSHRPRRMPVALKSKGNASKSTNSTSSHNSYRRSSPGTGASAIKESGGGSGQEVDARRCRKHRRRPRALLAMHSPHAAGDEEAEEESGVEGLGVEKKDQPGGGNRAGMRRSPFRWLETHIWHAKRMHMKEAWGFILPAESNRGPRASVKAALSHCTLQDATFLRPLELLGPRRSILGVLSAVTDPLDARATRQQGCVDGFVEARTHLYRVNEFPLGCIAPVSILWSPSDAVDSSPSPSTSRTSGAKGEEGMGEDDRAGEDDDDDDDDVRRVWLWVHPAAARETLREIRRACALEGAPWQGSVQAGPVPGGLCRLRVRGGRSHEIVQQVLRTESPKTAAAPSLAAEAAATGDHFEVAARDNAARWRSLASAPGRRSGRSEAHGAGGGDGGGDGGGGLRSLPAGSVLALTALDPREQRQGQRRRAATTHRVSPAPVSSGSTATTQTTQGKTSGIVTAVVAGGGREKPVGGGSSDQQQSSPAAAACEEWPPRWAAVSPLWDPDARAFSAKLAAARPDHVVNEARRRERSQGAWDHGATAAGSATAHRSTAGGLGRSGAAPVILVSASGMATTAHGEEGPAGMASSTVELFRGDRGVVGGRGGGSDERKGGGKEAEKKRRSIASGWDLILPPGWAPVFFGALVMAGARVISLKDADGLALEAGEARFPADYPDTVAGRRHWDEIGRLSEETWTRTRPKHRGFKRRPPPPTSKAATLGGAAAAERGSGTKGMDAGQEKGEPQSTASTEAKPAAPSPPWSPSTLWQFRPDFRSIASGGVAAEGPSGVTTDGGDPAAVRGGREEAREPYAVARGFQYVRAFLPDEGEEPAAAADEDRGVRAALTLSSTPPPPPPPPLRLAFPTVVELTITLEKGVAKHGAPIYPASFEHHALWLEGRRGGKPWPGFSPANQPSSSPSSPPRSSSAAPAAATAAAAAAAAGHGGVGDGGAGACSGGEEAAGESRPALPAAIGATTSGGFSFLRGGGAGRAVCEAVAVRDAFALSVACCRRRRGSGGRRRPRQPWALVLVGNGAGRWVRPAVAFVAAS